MAVLKFNKLEAFDVGVKVKKSRLGGCKKKKQNFEILVIVG